ncbi:Thiol protease aleurain [Zea mays]|uniref:Thiol protease aleurain n=1 Tax=Zea mays TaxID=4577 RepID=A0A1D6ER44_MAIZE|nr:Thiol protease aleurain [Zea mays]
MARITRARRRSRSGSGSSPRASSSSALPTGKASTALLPPRHQPLRGHELGGVPCDPARRSAELLRHARRQPPDARRRRCRDAGDERLEGGWDREPSEKPGPLWIMLDLQVTTEKSASSFRFSRFLYISLLENAGCSIFFYCFTLFPNVLKGNNIWESCQW